MKFYINPRLKGQATEYDFLEAEGGFYSTFEWGIYNDVIASISCDDPEFKFEISIRDGVLVFKRNNDIVIHPVPKHFGEVVTIGYAWTPNIIHTIFSLNKTPVLNPDNSFDNQENRIVKTPFTLPPNKLIFYARETEKIHIKTYQTKREFKRQVIKSLQLAQVEINQTGSYSNFWNTIKDSGKIIKREPKDEVELHTAIHSLLFDFCLKNGIFIDREKHTPIGDIDFVFHTFIDKEKIEIPCEVKKADSKDLIQGYKTQLPTYIKHLGSEFGIYLVACFDGEWWEGKNFREVHSELIRESDNYIRDKIKIQSISLGKPIPASKRKNNPKNI